MCALINGIPFRIITMNGIRVLIENNITHQRAWVRAHYIY
jgi:hypothetical protein